MAGWNRDRQVSATEASGQLGDVSVPLIGMWVHNGKLKPISKRGRSPLYLWGDLIDLEREMRRSPKSARNPNRGRNEQPALVAA